MEVNVDEFIKEIGLDEKFIARMKKRAKITSMRYEYILDKRKRYLLTQIRLAEIELEEEKENEGITYRSACVKISKYLGYRVDPKQ